MHTYNMSLTPLSQHCLSLRDFRIDCKSDSLQQSACLKKPRIHLTPLYCLLIFLHCIKMIHFCDSLRFYSICSPNFDNISRQQAIHHWPDITKQTLHTCITWYLHNMLHAAHHSKWLGSKQSSFMQDYVTIPVLRRHIIRKKV